MGGVGSGPPPSDRGVVEACPVLDINRLHRGKWLAPGRTWAHSWYGADGAKTALVVIRAYASAVRLVYSVSIGGNVPETVVHVVAIATTPCTLGGTRPFFICPGRDCGRRVAKLCGYGRHFLCRHCYRLTYSSRRERERARAERKANKVRSRLGPAQTMEMFPARPKGMWQRTYERLCDRIVQAERPLNEDFLALLTRTLGDKCSALLPVVAQGGATPPHLRDEPDATHGCPLSLAVRASYGRVQTGILNRARGAKG